MEGRVEFSKNILPLIQSKEIDIGKIWFTDKAHFRLSGYVNKQNYRIWGSEPPFVTTQVPQHSPSVGVWCGISAQGIIGPFFIDGTMNGTCYVNEILPEFKKVAARKKQITGYWWQQDGATYHRTKAAMTSLQAMF